MELNVLMTGEIYIGAREGSSVGRSVRDVQYVEELPELWSIIRIGDVGRKEST
jgi:hypothetical protein